jgi:glycerol-3-phosphate O-acyltransferase/dihydroxyacetone phosphate acyltransferase
MSLNQSTGESKRVSFGEDEPANKSAPPTFYRCDECGVNVPADEWPNHRDRLRSVHMKSRTKSFVQLYVLTPILNTFIWVLVNVFFREVAVVGRENIPTKGPVVFYGNHQNQFIDAMMMRAFCGRPVRFIIAEKSMTRPVIGQFARLMDAVPVVRPQDVPSTAGPGKLTKTDNTKIIGANTNFLTTVKQGDVVLWSSPHRNERCSGQVHQVTSDSEIVLTRPVPSDAEIDTPVNWKLSKRIDHSEMYADVYETLRAGGAIGIFPEGGSQDHTSLIPLKAGVALFTLGAAERDIEAKMVPVGLTYFFGHKFRSRAHIEFGKPLTADAEVVQQFVSDKRGATGTLLKDLDAALRGVTINVRDWSTLKFLHNFRRVYQPPGLLLGTGEYLGLTRRLAVITEEHAEDLDFQEFREKVENYSDFCNALFVRDSQAATLAGLVDVHGQLSVSLRLLARRIAMLCVLTFVLVPFFVVCGPVGILGHVLAEAHAKTALSASTVKVVAADVKASHKMVLGFVLVPIVFSLWSAVVAARSDLRTGLTVLISMPVAMYVSVVLVREWVMELFATLPLVMSIMSKHKQFLKLHERRCALVQQAAQIVEKYDPGLDAHMKGFNSKCNTAVTRQASLFSLRHHSRVQEQRRKRQ